MKPTKEQLAKIEKAFSDLIEAVKPFDTPEETMGLQIHQLAADIFGVIRRESKNMDEQLELNWRTVIAITPLPDNEIDEAEVARCSCGLVFYSMEYALEHECLPRNRD